MTRPFRFSVSLGAVTDPRALVVDARRAEELGYGGVTLPDHLDEQVGPMVGLTAVGLATDGLTLTSLVLANDYRHPAVLAKELASLDLLSGGRLEVGIGAGWMTADYERSGIPLDGAGTRIERLGEAITVLKGCFADGSFDFAGDHYSIRGLDSLPKPVQRPHPPLLVAGGGRKVLALAAREADIVGINFGLQAGVLGPDIASTGFAAATDDKLAVIRDHAGDRLDSIELQTRVHVAMITGDRQATLDEVAPAFGVSSVEAGAMPHVVVGTAPQCADTIRGWRDRWGISYVTWSADAMESMAPVVELLAGT